MARDDGSGDATPARLVEYARQQPHRFTLLANDGRRLGPAANFSRLMEQTLPATSGENAYLMFCDQDDVWHPGKIEKMLEVICQLEKRLGSQTPLLVHSDLRVVGEDLHLMAPSFWKYQKLDPSRGESFNKLIVQNVITGCGTIINRSLRNQALPIPAEAAMHDWWLGLIAAAFGKIEFVDESLVDYRQHQANRIGAKQWGVAYVLKAAFNPAAARRGLVASQNQAAAFYKRFGDALNPDLRMVTTGYAHLPQMGFFKRRRFLLKNGITKTGFSRNLGLMLWA